MPESQVLSESPVLPESRPAHEPGSLWQRYGWLYSGIWLVFLVFPLSATVGADTTVWQRALTIAGLAVFAGLYLRGFLLQDRLPADQVPSMAWRYLGALTLVGLATAATIGVEALALTPFLCSFAIFGLPIRPAFTVPVLCGILVLAVAAATSWWVALYLGLVVMVSVATGVVRVFEDTERTAAELRLQHRLAADRDRVARDVHDVLGHSLTVVAVKAELAGRLIDQDPERARSELADIQRLTRTALGEIRATVGGLRATRLTDEVTAAQAALNAAGIELHAPDDAEQVEPRARITLAWVVREAVTNVVRHSEASKVDIRWGADWLEVLDDGCGRRAGRDGNGLSGLRERVTAMGGRLEISDGPGGIGTLVRVEQS